MKKIVARPYNKICDGCILFSSRYQETGCIIAIPHISEDLYCPCSRCIVKSMCATTCNSFDQYKITSRYIQKEKWRKEMVKNDSPKS